MTAIDTLLNRTATQVEAHRNISQSWSVFGCGDCQVSTTLSASTVQEFEAAHRSAMILRDLNQFLNPMTSEERSDALEGMEQLLLDLQPGDSNIGSCDCDLNILHDPQHLAALLLEHLTGRGVLTVTDRNDTEEVGPAMSPRSLGLQGKRVVLTEEAGAISGELEVAVGDGGQPLVRYDGTDDWYHIVNEADETFETPEDLVTLIEGSEPQSTPSGNIVPFKVT